MSEEKVSQENPAQPQGPYVEYVVNPDAHPGGELTAIEQQKRQDTAQWEDAQNRSPIDGVNPAQPPGFAVPEPTGGPIPGQGADAIVARVFVNKTASAVIGGKVLLGTDEENYSMGEVIAVHDDFFAAKWRDAEEPTWEKKADYELVIRENDGDSQE